MREHVDKTRILPFHHLIPSCMTSQFFSEISGATTTIHMKISHAISTSNNNGIEQCKIPRVY